MRLAALVFVTGTTQAVVTWLQGGLPHDRDGRGEALADLAVARAPRSSA